MQTLEEVFVKLAYKQVEDEEGLVYVTTTILSAVYCLLLITASHHLLWMSASL